MNYPLISEYVEAIKAAEDNFDQLKHLRPVLGEDGEPVMTSGNFAVVFKMKDEQTGKLHAVKCFLKEQEGRAEAYRQIAEELEYVSSTFLTPIKYLDKELFVDSSNSEDSEFPVLLMDWVEGQTLDKYIREHIDDQYELSLLAYQFSRLAMWLMPQPFAHGDLKPDNILVKEDGTLVLVDYDGMYVPAMKGQKARELGSPDFRHPGRTEEVFDDHIDDFSLASILLSLKAIALRPSLLEEYGASDRLLFSEKDYRNLSESSALGALQPLMQNAELASLYSLFILALSQSNLSQVSFRLFNLSRPDRSQYEEEDLSTKIREEEYEYDNCWHDEFKVEYSKDRTRLLDACIIETDSYTIIDGTKIICDCAFEQCRLNAIRIPDSVIKIGDSSFAGCELSPVCLPSSIIEIGPSAFSESTINTIILNDGLKRIGDSAFELTNLISITIPKSVKEIGDFAFMECRKLVSVTFLNSNIKLGKEIFRECKQLKSICVPYNTASTFVKMLPKYSDIIEEDNCDNDSEVNTDYLDTEVTNEDLTTSWIGEYGVAYSSNRKRLLRANSKIVSFSVRKGVKTICDRAFCGDIMQSGGNYSLSSINIPESVISIGEAAFFGSKLQKIHIPETICQIGQEALCNCNNLTAIVVDDRNENFDSRNNCNAIIRRDDNVLIAGCKTTTIPHGVKKIGCHAFALCNGLISITIPDGVVEISEGAFFGCQNLSSVVIPESVTHICDKAFARCANLSEIVIPNSVEWIGEAAFASCKKLSKIVIPDSVVFLGNSAFEYCTSLQFLKLSNRLPIVGNMTFADCSSLKNITIPNGVTDIEDAFCNCKCLSSISIPNSVTFFGYNTFLNCYSLSEIIIPVGRRDKFEKLLPNYKNKLVEQDEKENLSTEVTEEDLANVWTDGYEVMYSADKKRLLKAPVDLMKYSIPEGTKVICNGYTHGYDWGRRKKGAFNGCAVLTRVEIPNTVTHIGYKAFYNCSNLTTLVFPDSIVSFGEQVFDGCFQLQKIFIPFGTKEKYNYWLPQFSHKFVEQIKGWTVKETRPFNTVEIAAVARAEVVPSQYGNSVCFFMNAGGQTYIPLLSCSSLTVGDSFDLKTAKLVTLCREGEKDICRVME